MTRAIDRPDGILSTLESDGFVIVADVLELGKVAGLMEATRACTAAGGGGVLRRGGEVYGVRDLIWRVPEVGELARSREILDWIEPILGAGAFVVRGLFFDKTP